MPLVWVLQASYMQIRPLRIINLPLKSFNYSCKECLLVSLVKFLEPSHLSSEVMLCASRFCYPVHLCEWTPWCTSHNFSDGSNLSARDAGVCCLEKDHGIKLMPLLLLLLFIVWRWRNREQRLWSKVYFNYTIIILTLQLEQCHESVRFCYCKKSAANLYFSYRSKKHSAIIFGLKWPTTLVFHRMHAFFVQYLVICATWPSFQFLLLPKTGFKRVANLHNSEF
jgi:hypothetical protein